MPFCSVLIFSFFLLFFSLVLLFLFSRISSRSILCIYVLVLCLHTNKDIHIIKRLKRPLFSAYILATIHRVK